MDDRRVFSWRERFTLFPFLAFVFILPFPGTVAFRLLCLVLCVFLAVAEWKQKAPPAMPARWAFLFWAAVALASLAYAIDAGYSLGEIKNEIGYSLLAFLSFFAFTRDNARLRLILVSMAASSLVVAVWSLFLRFRAGYWDEAAGHGGSGAFGSLSVVAMPVLCGLWFLWPRARAVWMSIGLVTVLAAYFSYQRAIWPIFAVEALTAAWLLSRRYRLAPSRRLRLKAALAGVILLAGAGWLAQGAKIATYGTAASLERDPRLLFWPAIAERILSNPLHGAGFGREAMKLGHPDLLSPSSPHFWHAHNVFLNYGLEMGLPGLIALSLLFIFLARCFSRMHADRDDLVSIMGLVGLLLIIAVVLRNVTNDFFVRDAALLFWALCGALFGAGLRLSSVHK